MCGLLDTNIQRKLLAETDLTLEKAVATGRAMEAAEQNACALQSSKKLADDSEVHALSQSASSTEPSTAGKNRAACTHCGRINHASADCRLQTAVCHFCQKCEHIARVCKARRSSKGRHQREQSTHVVEDGDRSTSQDNSSGDEELFNIQSKRAPIKVEVTANGKRLSMELNTGAARTVMSKTMYRSIWPQEGPGIQPSSTTLRTYTGELIQVKGKSQW